MPTPNVTFPFDPTGSVLSNRIIGEKHSVTTHQLKDFNFIIPKLAPFFRDTLKIVNLRTGAELLDGVDWIASHHFLSGSRATVKPIYGSISFLDKTFNDVVEIEYNTIGGEWTVDEATILEILMGEIINPRTTTWEQIVEIPRVFPPIDHAWHLDDMVGMKEIQDSLATLTDAVISKSDFKNRYINHEQNIENPHGVTKAQVQLDKVQNYPIAGKTQSELGESNLAYMTPFRVKQAITAIALTALQQHLDDTSDPHSVTKKQVGLEFVENFPIATIIEALAGERIDRYMTPKLTKLAIDDNTSKNLYTRDEVDKLLSDLEIKLTTP